MENALNPHPVDSDIDLLIDLEERMFRGTNPHDADVENERFTDGSCLVDSIH